MKRILIPIIFLISFPLSASAQFPQGFRERVISTIQKHLGRPYVWGASGLKSFDCSGFVWRVLSENRILLKRTTARKLYMMLPPAARDDEGRFGTLVFFDSLKHVGMVDTPDAFYHAQVSKGTNRSPMNAFWRRKIYGFRRIPVDPGAEP